MTFKGDQRTNVAVRHERNCCVGPDGNFSMVVCKQNMRACLGESFLLGGALTDSPSTHRCGSYSEHRSAHVAATMLFRLLPRSVTAAFNRWGDGDPGNENSDDYRSRMRGKVWRSCKVLEEPDREWKDAIRCWIAGPLGHMLQRIQYLDENGSTLIDVQYIENDPFREARRDHCRILFGNVEHGPLRTVFFSFCFWRFCRS